MILTALLIFVIMAVAIDTRAIGAAAATAIGGTVGLDALFGGPVTAASMNPARSFGPALPPEWTDFWVYVAGPLSGAALGAFAYQLVRGAPPRATPTPQADDRRPQLTQGRPAACSSHRATQPDRGSASEQRRFWSSPTRSTSRG